MRHIVAINDNTETGRSLFTIINNIKKSSNIIEFLTKKEFEEMEDKAIGNAIEMKRTEEFVDRSIIMELLER